MKKIIKIIKNLLIVSNKFENLLIVSNKFENLIYINFTKYIKTTLILLKFLSIFFIFFIICNLPLRFFNNFGYIYYLIVFFTLTLILINYFRNKT